MSIAENIREVLSRISEAAARSGRKADDVRLVAITKTVETDRIREAIRSGIRIFGENYVQEAREKIDAIGHDVEWHMTGHLQKNKAKEVVRLFDLVQTIDSLELAEELDKRAGLAGKKILALIEVNIGNESTKSGISEEKLIPLLRSLSEFKNITIKGLMAIPPYFQVAEEVRPFFRKLRDLRKRAEKEGFHLPELSMGMSHDFEIAVEEGATMVRVGTAIFGERD